MKNNRPTYFYALGSFLLFALLSASVTANKALDPDPPVAICETSVLVALGVDGTVDVPFNVFDDGSYDSCPPLTFAVRRTDLNCDGSVDDFGPAVSFCCDDIGTTDISVTLLVVDGEGNFSACQSMVTVVNDSPTAICMPGIQVLISDGSVTVDAVQLDDGSYDACGGLLTFSFSPDTSDDTVTYDCNDILCDPLQEVTLWVTDETGSQSTCESFIVVSDPGFSCGECISTNITGVILTEEDEGIADVEVVLNDGLFEQVTEADGVYSFSVSNGEEYWVYPGLDTLYSNGVSTYDMVLIRLHILGIQPLNSPYKLIAADVNNSGSITTLDILAIQQLILGLNSGFSDNTSWRFIDAAYEFPFPDNPWFEPFPEGVLVVGSGSTFFVDFTGVKIGDVNNSAIPN
ncbi:MAG: hypothetical protein KDC34_05860 [Saprospiraceae bacterium]|nr:hypothetical protein [Saprospiraceae bacterium]